MQRDKMTQRDFIGINAALVAASLVPRLSFAAASKSISNDNAAMTNTLATAVRRIDFSRFNKAFTAECQQSLDVLSLIGNLISTDKDDYINGGSTKSREKSNQRLS